MAGRVAVLRNRAWVEAETRPMQGHDYQELKSKAVARLNNPYPSSMLLSLLMADWLVMGSPNKIDITGQGGDCWRRPPEPDH